MFEIVVQASTKTDDLYEFSYSMGQQRSLRSRVLRPWRRSTGPGPGSRAFGFRALNYPIAHHEVWDGLYPLFYLTRNGGPLFEIGPRRAHIRFEYPIPAVVRDFFIRRAADFGQTIMVDAATLDARIEGPTHGDVLAFGGGKESRMLLGIMREGGALIPWSSPRGQRTPSGSRRRW